MAALALRRAQPVLAVALLCGGLLVAGCGDTSSGESRVPGVHLVDLLGVGVAAWSPDGHWIAAPGQGGVNLVSPASGRRKLVAAPPLRLYWGFPIRARWSRDGNWLRYVTSVGPEKGHGFWATQIRRDGSGLSQTPLGTELAFPAWSPGGWPLIFATGPYEFDLRGQRHGPAPALQTLAGPGAKPERLLATTGLPADPVVSPNGRLILFKQSRHHRTELWTVSTDGSGARRLAAFLLIHRAEWSPDGSQIGISAMAHRGDGIDHRLYLISASGGDPRLVSNEAVLEGPTWTPDGRWLTFSTPGGEIRRIPPDGTGAETIAEFDGEEVRGLLWSPDGHYLAYSASEPPREDLD
jgi:Tol biopolymer transport system component